MLQLFIGRCGSHSAALFIHFSNTKKEKALIQRYEPIRIIWMVRKTHAEVPLTQAS